MYFACILICLWLFMNFKIRHQTGSRHHRTSSLNLELAQAPPGSADLDLDRGGHAQAAAVLHHHLDQAGHGKHVGVGNLVVKMET